MKPGSEVPLDGATQDEPHLQLDACLPGTPLPPAKLPPRRPLAARLLSLVPPREDLVCLSCVGLACAIHVTARSIRPRKWRTLTSMKPWELYAASAAFWMVHRAAERRRREVFADPSTTLVATLARNFRETLAENPDIRARFEELMATDPQGRTEMREGLLGMCRRDAIARDDALGAVSWWFNHGWVDDDTWMLAAAYWFAMIGRTFGELDCRDVEVIITHTANTAGSQLSESTRSGKPMPVTVSVHPLVGLALSVPVAMLARRTQRPLFFLPMNAVQRLLMGAFVYLSTAPQYQHYSYLTTLRHKRRCAMVFLKGTLIQAATKGQLSKSDPTPGSGRTQSLWNFPSRYPSTYPGYAIRLGRTRT
ncbi:hypothetical protein OH77DRAFT_1427707 [Trametes cingulata]|nr:hypothetical protein OH77DRAFT_1427707 [Trametes cingulata]